MDNDSILTEDRFFMYFSDGNFKENSPHGTGAYERGDGQGKDHATLLQWEKTETNRTSKRKGANHLHVRVRVTCAWAGQSLTDQIDNCLLYAYRLQTSKNWGERLIYVHLFCESI